MAAPPPPPAKKERGGATAASQQLTIPVKALYEAVGHNVTVELSTKEVYRGRLSDVEGNMNILLSAVACTGKDGRLSRMEDVYLRGSHVRFIVLPDLLKNSPLFKHVTIEKEIKESKKRENSGKFRQSRSAKKQKTDNGPKPSSSTSGV